MSKDKKGLVVVGLKYGGPAWESPAPGVFASAKGDGYDASRLCLADAIRDCDVRGPYVAAAPNTNLLLMTGSEDAPGLRTRRPR